MIKRTSRKIAAHIYWIAAAFIFLALIAIPLLPRALGQAGNKTAPNQAARPAYNPAISSQTATVPGVRSIPILMVTRAINDYTVTMETLVRLFTPAAVRTS